MIQKTAMEMISRRKMLGILGAGVAFGIGAPAAVLTASEAEAQTPGAQPRSGERHGTKLSRSNKKGARGDVWHGTQAAPGQAPREPAQPDRRPRGRAPPAKGR
jgi:hypothetical protein